MLTALGSRGPTATDDSAVQVSGGVVAHQQVVAVACGQADDQGR
ncbi:hypothetical protein [Asanoa ishikariensis]|nr:hypothetical protein [Asanoa ishikariensis]